MVTLIGNQKGGAGKSTLTILLANYLTLVKKSKVTVLDMDYQQSIFSKSQKAKVLENEPLYEVIASDLKHFPIIIDVLIKSREENILIDLPGKMDDDELIHVLMSGELILCPFNYDELSVDSTLLFAMVTKKINTNAAFVFIPNRIKNTVRYDTKEEVDKILTRFGKISPSVPDRVDFQRVSTLNTPAVILPVILPLLDFIYQNYLLKPGSNE
jgi:chromosome partitioning protein